MDRKNRLNLMKNKNKEESRKTT